MSVHRMSAVCFKKQNHVSFEKNAQTPKNLTDKLHETKYK